ncbi:hypothetical protein EV424DRAFT_1353732 [Suillus variegatus]|nr:hypothetical protein EV424DRAFT_1353732 [Suillus variegatus]
MPPPTKRQKQAKQQHASSSRCFDNGLIEDVLEVFLDPDYVPVSDAESEADSESNFNGALSFSLIDGNIGDASDNESESDDEAAMEIVVHATGEKRKSREDLLETLAEFEAEETVDYAEGQYVPFIENLGDIWMLTEALEVEHGGLAFHTNYSIPGSANLTDALLRMTKTANSLHSSPFVVPNNNFIIISADEALVAKDVVHHIDALHPSAPALAANDALPIGNALAIHNAPPHPPNLRPFVPLDSFPTSLSTKTDSNVSGYAHPTDVSRVRMPPGYYGVAAADVSERTWKSDAAEGSIDASEAAKGRCWEKEVVRGHVSVAEDE